MEIRLLVIRTTDIDRLASFYELFGFKFEYHKHEKSPYHYSASIGNMVLEIYPLAKGQAEADKELRLGFSIESFEDIIQVLKDKQTVFLSEPTQTDYGFIAIIKDPDGRKIELYKNEK
jgi:lactoylglutathione lyase